MRVIIIGATGTIGKGVMELLSPDHELIPVGHRGGDFQVDLGDPESIGALFKRVGSFDALISAAGDAKFGSMDELADGDFQFSLGNKLMGQINLVREGRKLITPPGSITLTSGMLSQNPMPGTVALSMVNAGLEGFTRAAALEMPQDVRINVVSPVFVKETMEAMGMDSSPGVSALETAKAYRASLEGDYHGQVLDVREFIG